MFLNLKILFFTNSILFGCVDIKFNILGKNISIDLKFNENNDKFYIKELRMDYDKDSTMADLNIGSKYKILSCKNGASTFICPRVTEGAEDFFENLIKSNDNEILDKENEKYNKFIKDIYLKNDSENKKRKNLI
jgi:hypothetical protein